MTDDASVTAAARLIQEQAGGLDALVNNAGITGGPEQAPTTVDPETMLAVVQTNVIGVMRVTNAMLPMLRRAASPRIVNVSSSVGSLTRQTTPGSFVGPIAVAYAPSKTFLNAVMIQYAKELADTNILINAACPGFSAEDDPEGETVNVLGAGCGGVDHDTSVVDDRLTSPSGQPLRLIVPSKRTRSPLRGGGERNRR